MRILTIRIKNIQSLKGEHTLSFDKKPLSDAGLFLITGSTGAGKSTILDSITLALFNRVPRFAPKGTESISKTDIENAGSIVTHFTEEAYAEVEYESQHKIYRSKWAISKNRNGKFKDYEMSLADVESGKIFDLKKSQIPDENARILGLNYEQFIRSIILSQGDFARFLKSDGKERTKLLEEITGTHIYRQIGKKIFEISREKEGSIKELEYQKNAIAILPKEEVDFLISNKVAIENQEKSLQIQSDDINIKVNLVTQKLELLRQKGINDTQLKNWNEKKVGFTSKEIALKRHKSLEPIRGELTSWFIEKNRILDLELQLKNHHFQLDNATTLVNEALKTMSQLIGQDVNQGDFMEKMRSFENQIVEWDNQINSLKLQGETARKRLDSLWQKLNTPFFNEMKSIRQPENILLRIEDYRKMRDIGVYSKWNDEEVEIQLQKTHESIMLLNQKLSDIKVFLQQQEDKNILEKRIQDYQQNLPANRTLLETMQKEHLDLESQMKEYLAIKDNQLLSATFESHRPHLIDGKPCPLCGSIHHPYTETIKDNKIDNIFDLIKMMETTLKTKEVDLRNLSNKLLEAQLQNNRFTEEYQKLSTNQREWLVIWNNEIPTLEHVEKSISDKLIKINDLKQEKTDREEIKWLDEAASIVIELLDTIKNYQNRVRLRNDKFKGEKVQDAVNPIQNKFVESVSSCSTATALIKERQKELSISKDKFLDISQKIENKIKTLGYEGVEDCWTDILDDSVYQIYQSEYEEIHNSLTGILSNQESIDQQLSVFKDLEASDGMLDDLKIQQTALDNNKKEKSREVGVINEKLQKNNDEVERKEKLLMQINEINSKNLPLFKLNTLIGDLNGVKYAKFAQNLSLSHLIAKANFRLQQLTDRYRLDFTDIEEDLRVVDFYQAETTRSAKTLSGGETFIVSLALALSLSDMASQNVRMESLFIDEGFGTLDQETLEMSISTLERLQSESQKTIGIISHVELLKERIHTQIKVIKSPSGYSELIII